MKLSTRARYGTRFLLFLALNGGKGPILLKDIAQKENISMKYLSHIVMPLKGVGLITSDRGAHGGYMLARPASKITLKEIVEVLEGDICLVECIRNKTFCNRRLNCTLQRVWLNLSKTISQAFANVSLEDLVKMDKKK